jgi:FtsP/CotA-like multicopper oxidase with cupredoxin domain
MPDGAVIPIWGFAQNTGTGCGAAQLPGPVVEVTAGDTVTVKLSNELAENVSILFRGQDLLPDLQGVPSGTTKAYRFTATNPGAYLYEAGMNLGIQGPMGLYGALIVRPTTPGQAYDDPSTAFDQAAVLVLSEIDPNLNANPAGFDRLAYHPTYWLINGRAYPQTAQIGAAAGDRVLLRYLNASSSHLSMSLLGMHQRVIAKDADPLAHPYEVADETIASGQTVDTLAVVPSGGPFPLYSRQMYLTNGALPAGASVHATGGMLTFVGNAAAAVPQVAVSE